MHNFKELKDISARLVQRSGDDDYEDNVIGPFVNLGLEQMYNNYDYYIELIGEPHNFTTVDGTKRYYMPLEFGKPLRFYDITNNKPITIKTYEEYFDANIANIADANESDADSAYFVECVGVKRQVATTGDTLQAKGANTADSCTVRIEGYLDDGLTIVGYEDIVVSGTSAATATSSQTFYKILNVSKSANTTGYVTLEDSSGNALTVLGQIDRVARHYAFDLGKIPDDSTTSMRVLFKRRFRRLVDDNDYPFVEADNFLIFNAVALARQEEKERADIIATVEKRAERAFQNFLLQRTTQFGPNFQQKMETSFVQAFRV